LLSALTLILTISFILALLSNPASVGIFYILLAFTLTAYLLSRSRLYRVGAYFFSFGFTSFAYITIYLGTANTVETAINAFVPVALILSSALLSQRGFVMLAISTVIATILVPYYSQVPPAPHESMGRMTGIILSINALLVGINAYRANAERARLKQVLDINRELEEVKTNLEKRVGERTLELETINRQTSRRAAQLQAITELSESIGQLQNLGEFFPRAVELISRRFGFYHVGIFLVDQDRQFAILQAANSEGGKRMLARGHRLRLGTGVVGYAAQTGQPRIALDVGVDAAFFDNPDLPDTRSEVALPMRARGETIGVLDVQSTEPGAFTPEDTQVLIALANQAAIALENARLLADTRAALTQVQEVYDEFTRAEWSRTAAKAEQAGFRYNNGRIEMLERALTTAEVVSAVATGAVSQNQANGSEAKRSTVAVPVKLRGEVIGVLHIEAHDESKTWLADEISLVEAVAERAAFALENARLFQDARRRAAKERLISEAATKISGASTIENILQTTAQELERVLGGSEVLIQFQSKESS
jgi:GAF domain-containing protein